VKTCFRCGVEKPASEFYKHPQMDDGRLGKCKECNKLDVRENYAKKRERYRKYERKRFNDPKRRAYCLEANKIHRRRNPEKTRARQAFAYAVKSGRLERKPCEVCGSIKSQGHHDDYSKPLDVKWLCFKHHRERHGQIVTAKV
jgi:hypothetical protein